MSLLVLLLAEADPLPEEKRGKENPDRPRSSSDSKIVFTLLTEVVAVHVRLSAIYVSGMGFQLLPGRLGDNGSWGGSENRSESLNLQNGFKNPLQVILGILVDISSNNRGVSSGAFRFLVSSGLVGQFVTWLGRWRRVKGGNKRSDGGSNRETLPMETSAALDWDHLRVGADFL